MLLWEEKAGQHSVRSLLASLCDHHELHYAVQEPRAAPNGH